MSAGRRTALLFAAVAGCAVVPSYRAPDPGVPQSYGELGS